MTAGHPLTGPIRVPPLFPGGVAVSDLCVYDTEGADGLAHGLAPELAQRLSRRCDAGGQDAEEPPTVGAKEPV